MWPLLTAILLAQVPALRPGQEIVDPEEGGRIVGEVIDATTSAAIDDVPLILLRPSSAAGREFPEPWVADSADGSDRPVARVHTAPDGSFRFDGLEPGHYIVRSAGRWVPRRQVEVWLDERIKAPRIQLELPAGARIAGEVVDSTGAPLAEFPVFVAGHDAGDGSNRGRGKPASMPTRTDAAGRFELRWVPAGEVHVQAALNSLGYSPPIVMTVGDGDRPAPITLVVPDERQALLDARDGGAGVGVRLDFTELGPVVASLIDGMPAEAAGMRAGDLITAVDGRPTRFMTSGEFINRCRGRVGQPVTLALLREDGETLEVRFERARLPDRPKE